ncbi:MAG: hypothetical protein V7721_01005 [Porticoccaceae bacterium]
MKIVIQDGKNIGKHDLDTFLATIPSSWRKLFDTIVVYGSREESLKITHHEKESVIGIHCPITYQGSSTETLEEVAINLSALHDFRHIPAKLSASRRENYLLSWHDYLKSS